MLPSLLSSSSTPPPPPQPPPASSSSRSSSSSSIHVVILKKSLKYLLLITLVVVGFILNIGNVSKVTLYVPSLTLQVVEVDLQQGHQQQQQQAVAVDVVAKKGKDGTTPQKVAARLDSTTPIEPPKLKKKEEEEEGGIEKEEQDDEEEGEQSLRLVEEEEAKEEEEEEDDENDVEVHDPSSSSIQRVNDIWGIRIPDSPQSYKFYVYENENVSGRGGPPNQQQSTATASEDVDVDVDVVLADLFLRYPVVSEAEEEKGEEETPPLTTTTTITPFAIRTRDPTEADVFIVPPPQYYEYKQQQQERLKYYDHPSSNQKIQSRHLFLSSSSSTPSTTTSPFLSQSPPRMMRTSTIDLRDPQCSINSLPTDNKNKKNQNNSSNSDDHSWLCPDFVIPYWNNNQSFRSRRGGSSSKSQEEEWWTTRKRKYAFAAIYNDDESQSCDAAGYGCFRKDWLQAATTTTSNVGDDKKEGETTTTIFPTRTTNKTLGGLPIYIETATPNKEKKETDDIYKDSIFCPILPNETNGPTQQRFFDVVRSGCIPVVFVFDRYGDNSGTLSKESRNNNNNHPNWWDGLNKSVPKWSTIRTSYPFAKGIYPDNPSLGIDYQELVVQIRPDATSTSGCDFGCGHHKNPCRFDCLLPHLEALLVEDEMAAGGYQTEIMRLRKNLMRASSWFSYDLEEDKAYKNYDAFAVLLNQLGHKLERMTPLTTKDRDILVEMKNNKQEEEEEESDKMQKEEGSSAKSTGKQVWKPVASKQEEDDSGDDDNYEGASAKSTGKQTLKPVASKKEEEEGNDSGDDDNYEGDEGKERKEKEKETKSKASAPQEQQQQQQEQPQPQQKDPKQVKAWKDWAENAVRTRQQQQQQQQQTSSKNNELDAPAAPTPYKFYVYNQFLDNELSPYNLTVKIRTKVKRPGNCEWGLSPCIDDGSAYFVYGGRRNNANADVVLADMFLRYPTDKTMPFTPFATRTSDPRQADVFIVPYAHDTHCKTVKFDNRCTDPQMKTLIPKILDSLEFFQRNNTSFDPKTKELTTTDPFTKRHLFLSSTCYPFANRQFINSVPMRTTIGGMRKPPCSVVDKPGSNSDNSSKWLCPDYVIPYLSQYPDYQPPNIRSRSEDWWTTRKRKYAVAAMFGQMDCPTGSGCFRNAFLNATKEMFPDNTLWGLPVQIGSLGKKRNIAKETATFELYQNTIFCPILPGDGPAQKRFFDVIMSGCIPVVFVFDRNGDNTGSTTSASTNDKNAALPSWWDGMDRSVPKWSTIRTSYPFAKGFYPDNPNLGIDYQQLVVQIHPSPHNGCNFACGHSPKPCQLDCVAPYLEALLDQTQQTEILRLRRNLMKAAGWFSYGLKDNSFKSYDAFAVLLTQLGHTLERMPPIPAKTRAAAISISKTQQ